MFRAETYIRTGSLCEARAAAARALRRYAALAHETAKAAESGRDSHRRAQRYSCFRNLQQLHVPRGVACAASARLPTENAGSAGRSPEGEASVMFAAGAVPLGRTDGR